MILEQMPLGEIPESKWVFECFSFSEFSVVRYGSSSGSANDDRYPPERGSYGSERQERGGYDSSNSSGGYGSSERGYGAPDRGYGPPPDRGYGPPPERSRAAGYGPPADRPYSSGSYSSGGKLNTSSPWLLSFSLGSLQCDPLHPVGHRKIVGLFDSG